MKNIRDRDPFGPLNIKEGLYQTKERNWYLSIIYIILSAKLMCSFQTLIIATHWFNSRET